LDEKTPPSKLVVDVRSVACCGASALNGFEALPPFSSNEFQSSALAETLPMPNTTTAETRKTWIFMETPLAFLPIDKKRLTISQTEVVDLRHIG
jgi:hypothetical protein